MWVEWGVGLVSANGAGVGLMYLSDKDAWKVWPKKGRDAACGMHHFILTDPASACFARKLLWTFLLQVLHSQALQFCEQPFHSSHPQASPLHRRLFFRISLPSPLGKPEWDPAAWAPFLPLTTLHSKHYSSVSPHLVTLTAPASPNVLHFKCLHIRSKTS